MEQWKQYLPEQFDLVNDYRLKTSGNYVLFAISWDVDKVVDIFTAAVK